MKRKEKYYLLAILLLTFILRITALSNFPIGFTPDEAAQGYTAYSILKTGRDEWGKLLPLSPRSFGDFKPPLFTYLIIPSVAIFGLDEFAVRLPAAIFGTLAVLATFLMVKELFRRSAFRIKYSVFSSLLLAISPWHIQLSRGFEFSLLAFLIPLGIWLFLLGSRESKYIWLSAIPFGLSLFAYHPAKIFTPLLLVLLIFWKRKETLRLKRPNLIFLLIIALFIFVSFLANFSGGKTRASDIIISNPTGGWNAVADWRFRAIQNGLPDQVARLFNNKLTYLGEQFSKNYLQYFSLEFLFGNGPGEGFYGMLPGRGMLYLFELPLFLTGVFAVLKKKDSSGIFLMAVLLLAPIPAALAKGPGYAAGRAIIMLPYIQIISAYGGISLWEYFVKRSKLESKRFVFYFILNRTALGVFSLVVLFSLAFFLEDYFIHSPAIIAEPMQNGWRETMTYVKEHESDYQQIIVSRRFSEPQAYVMFYNKMDPVAVQEESTDWLRYQKENFIFLDQLGEYSLGKYTFRHLNFSADKELKEALLVGKPEEFPINLPTEKTVYYPNGKPAFVIVDPAKP